MTDRPVGPPDARVVPRFAGPDTFARLPRLVDVGSAAVSILGVPFDAGVSYRPGARFGPAAVRAGSKLLRPYHPGLEAEPWTTQQVADAGDVAANPFSMVEVAPPYDHAELTAMAATNIVYELLALLARRAGRGTKGSDLS
jgi:agmatinase